MTISIAVDITDISDLSYYVGDGPSEEQSFTVFGVDLIDDITLSAPTNYEISEASESGYGSAITLTESNGIVAETTIYVRLKAGLSAGSYSSEDITISSTGKISKTVTCSGFVGYWILNIKVFIQGALW